MASSLPADMLAEMKGLDRIFLGIELDIVTAFGTTTTLKYAPSGSPLPSDSLGMFLPYITAADFPARVADTVNFSLGQGNGSVTIADRDRQLQYALGGASRAGIRGVAIRAKLVSADPDVSPFTFLNGIVTNYGSSGGVSGTPEFQIEFSPPLAEFDSAFNLPLFSTDLFPSIPQAYRDTDTWLLYGQHKSSAGTGGQGMIKATPIGESDIWVCSVAQIEGVDAVYYDGAARPAADWSQFPIGRGRHYFYVVRFDANAPEDTDTVTFDGRGITDDPTFGSSGDMVENPIEIMRNAVANFVYQDGTTRGLTAWDDETTIPMASTILDASSTYYDNIGAKASAQIFASSTPRQFVSAMGEDWGAVPFFTLGEEFALKAEDPGEIDLYADEDAHIAEKLGHVREYKGMETARQPTETTLRVSRVLNRSTGSFAQTFEVADRDVTTEIIKELQLETSRASLF